MKHRKILALLLVMCMLVEFAACESKVHDDDEPTSKASGSDTSKDASNGILDGLFGDDSSGDESQGGFFDHLFGDDSSDTSDTSDSSGVSDDDIFEDLGPVPSGVGNNEREFTMLIVSDELQATYYCDDVVPNLYKNTDADFNQAVSDRNEAILDKYNIRIKAYPAKVIVTSLKNDVMAGTGDFDAVMMFAYEGAMLASGGYLYDLSNFLELDEAWWDQSANEALSIAGHQYFAIGDISTMPKKVTSAVFFNKNMMSKAFPDFDIYSCVRDSKWTLDKMIEMSRAVTADTDGVSGLTKDDTWGTVGSYSDASLFFSASGGDLFVKTDDDIPRFSADDLDKADTVLNKMLDFDQWMIRAQDIDSYDIWTDSLEIFTSGRALFRTSALVTAEVMREYDCEYGIVPIPKLDINQENYHAAISGSYANCVGIPVSANDPVFSAFVINAMGCGARHYITPAYYDMVAKGLDEDTREMLDIVFYGANYDVDEVYRFSNSRHFLEYHFAESLLQRKNSFRRDIEAVLPKIDNAIDEYVEMLG